MPPKRPSPTPRSTVTGSTRIPPTPRSPIRSNGVSAISTTISSNPSTTPTNTCAPTSTPKAPRRSSAWRASARRCPTRPMTSPPPIRCCSRPWRCTIRRTGCRWPTIRPWTRTRSTTTIPPRRSPTSTATANPASTPAWDTTAANSRSTTKSSRCRPMRIGKM